MRGKNFQPLCRGKMPRASCFVGVEENRKDFLILYMHTKYYGCF
jgi:hypothetical protein